MLSLALSLLVLATALAIRALYQIHLHPLSRYPGPLPAKLTYLWRLRTFLRGKQHFTDLTLHARYGPIVRDGPNSLLLADIGAYKRIYGFERGVEKGDFYASQANGDAERPLAFTAKTEALHRVARRRLVSVALTPKHVAEYEDAVSRGVGEWLDTLTAEVKGQGGNVDVVPSVKRFAFDTTLQVAFGQSMELMKAGRDVQGAIAGKEEAFGKAFAVAQVPFLSRLSGWKPIQSLLRRRRLDTQGRGIGMSAVVQWYINSIKTAFSTPRKMQPSILKNLIELDGADSRKMTQEGIQSESFNAIFAGTGSIASALIAILYELSTHPDVQGNLYSELKALPAETCFPSKKLAGVTSLQILIKEALRLRPPFAAPFERVIGPGGETAILGPQHPLPVGTRVWSNAFVINRSRQVFGDDADEFRPGRWLEDPAERMREMEDVWCVFGRGSRKCVGRDVAWMVLEKAVAEIVRKWEIRCENGCLKGFNWLEMQYEELSMTFEPRG